MTIEEKAKAYDEAIEIIQKYVKDDYGCIRLRSEDIFPELKESEDERIRKALRERIIRYDPNNEILIKECGISQKQFLAWLEKQGEQKPADKIEHKFNVGDIIRFRGSAAEYMIKRVTDTAYYTDWWSCGIERCEKDYELVEQNPNNKVEPKFKVGDWIVNNEYGHVIKVLDINKEQYTYRLDYGDTYGTIIISLIDNDYHLWTIQDAKDGDVLATKSGRPFIFKGLLDKCYPENPVAYCGIDSTDEFFLSTGDWMWTNEEVYPATKEQRDLLFQKMKEAGYEWNAEKKELKKIEQKPAWSEEDEYTLGETIQHLEELIRIDKAKHCACDVQYYQRDIDWLKSLKERYTWKPSDEQIKGIECAIITLRSQLNVGDNRLNSLYNDLKKLREE